MGWSTNLMFWHVYIWNFIGNWKANFHHLLNLLKILQIKKGSRDNPQKMLESVAIIVAWFYLIKELTVKTTLSQTTVSMLINFHLDYNSLLFLLIAGGWLPEGTSKTRSNRENIAITLLSYFRRPIQTLWDKKPIPIGKLKTSLPRSWAGLTSTVVSNWDSLDNVDCCIRNLSPV